MAGMWTDSPNLGRLAKHPSMIEDSRVSVVVPTHNRLHTLKRAIDSVWAQDYPHIELVIIDDGSNDGTWEYLSSQAHRFAWKVARNEIPRGACSARNQAIELASGVFIANLDDDDYFEPDRISKLLAAFHEGFSAVTSYDGFFTNKGRTRIWQKKGVITHDDLLYKNRAGNAFLTRKSFLLSIGGFDESLRAAQDHDVFVRLAKAHGPVNTVPLVLHNIDDEGSNVRITTSSAKWIGYYDFYCKHKVDMNKAQRGSNLYVILKAKGKANLRKLLSYVPAQFWPVEVIGLIRRTLN